VHFNLRIYLLSSYLSTLSVIIVLTVICNTP
jgi:hypothetical protein